MPEIPAPEEAEAGELGGRGGASLSLHRKFYASLGYIQWDAVTNKTNVKQDQGM